MTIFSLMFAIACCLVVRLELGLGLGLDLMSRRLVVMHTYSYYFLLLLSHCRVNPHKFRETSRDFMSCMKAHTCEFVEIRCNMAASKRLFFKND